MNLPSRTDLQEILKLKDGPCVSLFMPTYRASGADRRQGPRQLQNLLDEARNQLGELGLPAADSDRFLEKARALVMDTSYWRSGLADGLAIFVSGSVFRDYKVPLMLDEKLFVDDRFHVAPLLALFSGDTRFYVLAISQNEVRLLEGDRHDIHELEPKGLPTSLADALTKVETNAPPPQHLHDDRHDQRGHGSGLEHAQQRLERYFRELDSNLANLIGGDQAPLVLAGVERNVGIFRQVSSYKKIPEGFIDGNPELMNAKQLHAQALSIVEPHFRREEESARQQFEKLGGSDRVTTDPAAIVTAAENGRIDTLFLKKGHRLWGRFDRALNAPQVHDRPSDGDQDLTCSAAEQTFLNGGAVFLCADEVDIPRQAAMAALLRY
jgi:hypothetical protein